MITRKEFYENQKRCELNIAAVAQTFPVDTEKLRKYFISYDEAIRITNYAMTHEVPCCIRIQRHDNVIKRFLTDNKE